MSTGKYQLRNFQQDPPDYHYGTGVPSESNPLVQLKDATPVRLYPRLSTLLRSSQVLLYVVSYIQLLCVCAAGCVFAYRVNDSDAFHPASIATMGHNMAALVCAAVGLMAASGRSRVVMVALIILSVSVMTQGCILIDFFRERCYFIGTTVTCNPAMELYSHANYQALLANLGVNAALAICAAGTSVFMLIASILAKDVTP